MKTSKPVWREEYPFVSVAVKNHIVEDAVYNCGMRGSREDTQRRVLQDYNSVDKLWAEFWLDQPRLVWC